MPAYQTHIMIVEDNPGDVRLVRELLADIAGLILQEEAGTLHRAREILSRQCFDLILLDLGLPDSQGLQTLAEIQIHAADIPIIVLTGLDDGYMGLQAMQLGAQDYLIKGSFHADLLNRAIYYAIERKKIQISLNDLNLDLEKRIRERTAELSAANEQLSLSLTDREAAERKFRRMVEALHEGIWVINAEEKTTFVNPRMAEMLGYASEEMVGRLLISFMDAEGTKACEQHIAQRRQGSREQIECELIRKDGSRITALLGAAPLIDADARYYGAIAGVMDITERKRLEQELQRAHDELRNISRQLVKGDEIQRKRLAAELHDQVGQNLTVLGINLNIMRNLLSEERGNDMILNRIDASLKVVENIGRQIRDVMANLRPSALDDYGLLAALQWFGRRCEAKTGISVAVTGTDISPRPDTDTETALYRIAQEAVHNVVKHAAAQQINIHIDTKGAQAILTIADDGIGFSCSASKPEKKQAGWGLAIMKERAASIGADFQVQSRPGQGTLVAVWAPL